VASERTKLKCPQCGKTFLPPRLGWSPDRKWCSRSCKDKAKRERAKLTDDRARQRRLKAKWKADPLGGEGLPDQSWSKVIEMAKEQMKRGEK